MSEDIPQIAVEDGEPDKCLGEELTEHGGIDVVAGEPHQFL